MTLPTTLNVSRKREDTYAEKFKVNTDASEASFALEVEGLGTLTGVVSSTTVEDGEIVETEISFPVNVNAVANGAVGQYDFDVVMTLGGLSQTIIEGKWNIVARTVS